MRFLIRRQRLRKSKSMLHVCVASLRFHERFLDSSGNYFVEPQQKRIDGILVMNARFEDSDLTKTFELHSTVVLAMRFIDVLPRLKVGKKYRRLVWCKGIYITFDEGVKFVTLHGRNAPMRWTPYKDDFDEEDWVEVE